MRFYNVLLACFLFVAACLGCTKSLHLATLDADYVTPQEAKLYKASVKIWVSCITADGMEVAGAGSGFAFAPNKILTAKHVVLCGGSDNKVSLIKVTSWAEQIFRVTDVRLADGSIDAAVLVIDGKLDNYLPVSTRQEKIGARICVLASVPLRSKKCGQVAPYQDMFWMFGSVLVVPGNSGAPVVNSDGEVVAIVVRYDRREALGIFELSYRWKNLLD